MRQVKKINDETGRGRRRWWWWRSASPDSGLLSLCWAPLPPPPPPASGQECRIIAHHSDWISILFLLSRHTHTNINIDEARQGIGTRGGNHKDVSGRRSRRRKEGRKKGSRKKLGCGCKKIFSSPFFCPTKMRGNRIYPHSLTQRVCESQ